MPSINTLTNMLLWIILPFSGEIFAMHQPDADAQKADVTIFKTEEELIEEISCLLSDVPTLTIPQIKSRLDALRRNVPSKSVLWRIMINHGYSYSNHQWKLKSSNPNEEPFSESMPSCVSMKNDEARLIRNDAKHPRSKRPRVRIPRNIDNEALLTQIEEQLVVNPRSSLKQIRHSIGKEIVPSSAYLRSLMQRNGYRYNKSQRRWLKLDIARWDPNLYIAPSFLNESPKMQEANHESKKRKTTPNTKKNMEVEPRQKKKRYVHVKPVWCSIEKLVTSNPHLTSDLIREELENRDNDSPCASIIEWQLRASGYIFKDKKWQRIGFVERNGHCEDSNAVGAIPARRVERQDDGEKAESKESWKSFLNEDFKNGDKELFTSNRDSPLTHSH